MYRDNWSNITIDLFISEEALKLIQLNPVWFKKRKTYSSGESLNNIKREKMSENFPKNALLITKAKGYFRGFTFCSVV